MGTASQRFDRHLFTRKLSELSHQMQIKSNAAMGAAPSLVKIVDHEFALLRDEWLTGVDRIAREVWQTQGEEVTPDFVRDVLVPETMTLIGARESTVKSNVALAAQRTRLEDPHDAQHHLAMEIRKLKGEVANRYEIEARELDYQKAPAAQKSGPQSQLDELGSIRGLIEDATKDTTLWLQADPSAEERAHVLAMQERLTDLDRIIARRVERRSLPNDGNQWSETVAEVLSLLDKAREVRGNIVSKDKGKGLARLAEHLPKELPGKKGLRRVKIPPPVKPVWTGGGLRLDPKPTQILANREFEEPMTKPASTDPATWRSCSDEFKQLADEETRIIRATKKERLLADCDFDSSATFEQTTKLELRKGPDEHLRVRLESLATKAGIALGCAENGVPLKFWLFKLFLYLSETKSHHLFAPPHHGRIGDNPHSDLLKPHAGETVSRAGGTITNVYEASASFCFWLEKQALEAEHRRGGVDLKSQNKQLTPPGAWSEPADRRLRSTVHSPIAARRMETYLKSKAIGQTDFAATVGTTDRTLRSFRKTGKVRRDIFDSIATHMGTTKEALLRPE
jgi:hypothetical protein